MKKDKLNEFLSESLRHHTNMDFQTILFTKNEALFIKVSYKDLEIEKEIILYNDFSIILKEAISELTSKLNLDTLNLD